MKRVEISTSSLFLFKYLFLEFVHIDELYPLVMNAGGIFLTQTCISSKENLYE